MSHIFSRDEYGHRSVQSGQTLESLVGLPEDFTPECLAPPVNKELLRAFADKDPSLSEIERDEVRGNLAHFRSWRDALGAIFHERGSERGS